MSRPKPWFVSLLLASACTREPAPTMIALDSEPEQGLENSDALAPATVRELAVGSLEGLTPAQRRSFSEEVGYVPIPAPGKDDWLATHPEPGQSFEAFLRSGSNLPDDGRRTIYLLPIGPFASEFVVGPDGAVLVPSPPLVQLEEFAQVYFQLQVEVLDPVAVEDLQVTSRDHHGRRQLQTPGVLRALARRVPKDAYCLIGVTMEDLYPAESWNFVFGYASLSERVGVYSFARYDPAFYGKPRGANADALILRRGLKVMAHEIGHMFGAEHCIYYNCVMNGSNHLEESDTKPMHLCPVCLRKLQHSIGFDVQQRYTTLAAFYDRVGFANDVAWTHRRLAFIAGDGVEFSRITVENSAYSTEERENSTPSPAP